MYLCVASHAMMQVSFISPTDGCEEIANPFLNPADE
jgi:hypothetical protein